MSRRNLTIGLFGFGCVGYGLHEVLQKTPGLKTTIKKICVKNRQKPRQLSPEKFTFDRYEILDDPEINVVVELIDDADAAFEIVSAAIVRGKAVVSANKKMISENFAALLELQRVYQVPVLYEAACCASIPIIRNLEEYYDTDLLSSVEGIVNGSCNYILTKVFGENKSFGLALREAQQLGYAETDPRLDTDGHDTRYKLQILLAHAFGVVVKPDTIFTVGINQIGPLETRFAQEKNGKIKLVATAIKSPDNTISYFVAPKLILPSDKLYNVEDVFNGVIAHTSFSETQFFVGKGAGAYPTASAVLSDLSALTYGYRYEYKKLVQQAVPVPGDELLLTVYLRANRDQQAQFAPYFVHIQEEYTNAGSGYLIGEITLHNLGKAKFLADSEGQLFSVVVLSVQENNLVPELYEEEAAEAVFA